MQVGFIGTGSMGSILIRSFITSRALSPEQIIAYNRTPSKALSLAQEYRGISIAESNSEVVEKCDILFLCVKPFEYRQVLQQVKQHFRAEQILITITSPVDIADLEQLVPCPVIRVVPSITNAASSGLTLIEFGSQVTEGVRQTILSLVSHISRPIEVKQTFLRIASDISSCGPAFLSYILQQMIESAVQDYKISPEAATYLTTQMVIGFADLLKQEIFSLPALQERVCVPKGITGEGLSALQEHIPGVFNEVFHKTHAKFEEDCDEMKSQLVE
ncbi:late competence protein ComER [Brevibacillus sp. SYSU BS000544]|uniref:late competence protein ComER n=1 Tax=Brevibacillus sp. SYSU BS000544 TaxID=3416443 RepID=UPI003CE597E1